MVKLLENSKEDYVSVASKTLTHFIINITKKEKIAIFFAIYRCMPAKSEKQARYFRLVRAAHTTPTIVCIDILKLYL